jgi:endonuclease YncB( thermonuclease family)
MNRALILAISLAFTAGCGKPAAPPKVTEPALSTATEPATPTTVTEPAIQAAVSGKPFERLDGCTLVPNKSNDGDSFYVRTAYGRTIVPRLYFVDTPEGDTKKPDRLAEQAEYFGITPEQAITVAQEAAAFTSENLAATFVVWTRWSNSTLGRVFAIVTVNERDLNELLVENGLARIYGEQTPLPDGRDSRKYLARLAEIEARAKRDRKGAWRFTK